MPNNKQDQKTLLPTTVEILPTGLPPYTETAEFGPSSATAMEDWHPNAPQNNILIARTFGSVKSRFTVDPNIHPPRSLLRAVSAWEKEDGNFKTGDAVELDVGWGRIDAEVCVLPVSEGAVCEQNGYPCCPKKRGDHPPPCTIMSRLSVRTFIGDVTLKVDVGKLSPCTPRLNIYVMTVWGQVALFLPRSFHGPLVTSCSGTPRLSSTLARMSTPIKEVGREKRWFVGDVSAWRAGCEHGDNVTVGSSFGKVWVGYEGEEEEARRALRWGPVQWLAHIVPAVLTLWFLRIVLAILLWFMRLFLVSLAKFDTNAA
ncbi:hypothetical protein FB45DRAFT_1031005 [Roridomyces roridus]|uniref:DUF7330 domain-containing protein n=1 Tax=Roridomyces roridus TaxID=1738132 RepID=A0AAD7BM55_9AGAR|nr:hypothetical protein FB45DRAFT_1031005 [Roridomyces roridus]